jgi:hypothetical protein
MKSSTLMCLLIVATALGAGSGNALDDAREIPARALPVPETASPALRALIAGPLPPFWNLHPKSSQGWKEFVQQRAASDLQLMPALREKWPSRSSRR